MNGEAAAALEGCSVTLADNRQLVLTVPDMSGTLILFQ